jgi:hypothetical protein
MPIPMETFHDYDPITLQNSIIAIPIAGMSPITFVAMYTIMEIRMNRRSAVHPHRLKSVRKRLLRFRNPDYSGLSGGNHRKDKKADSTNRNQPRSIVGKKPDPGMYGFPEQQLFVLPFQIDERRKGDDQHTEI